MGDIIDDVVNPYLVLKIKNNTIYGDFLKFFGQNVVL